MTIEYARIATRLYNSPLLLSPDVANTVGDYIMARIRGDDVVQGSQTIERSLDRGVQAGVNQGARPYSLDSGIALIAIRGELVNRGAWVGANSGLTSYEGIVAQLKAAARDVEVQGIMLEIDSPGGEAAGLAAVTEAIRAVGKPIWSIANAAAMSAAYWIGSAAQRMAVVPDANGVGSIGVVWMHLDRSEQLQKLGTRVTVVQAGAKKTQFSSLSSLSSEARARAEEVVGSLYDGFVAHVANARNLSEAAVRGTEAAVFMAKEAKKIGLVDEVATVDQFHSAMVKAVRTGSAQASKGKPPGAQTEGIRAGPDAQHNRVAAIMACDEAKGRSKLASHLALSTDTSFYAAKCIMRASAMESLNRPRQALKTPTLTAGADRRGNQDSSNGKLLTATERAAAIRARCAAQFGKPQPGIR